MGTAPKLTRKWKRDWHRRHDVAREFNRSYAKVREVMESGDWAEMDGAARLGFDAFDDFYIPRMDCPINFANMNDDPGIGVMQGFKAGYVACRAAEILDNIDRVMAVLGSDAAPPAFAEEAAFAFGRHREAVEEVKEMADEMITGEDDR